MATIGRVNCYACTAAPPQWHCKKNIGINRLYHIHSGNGGYIHNGKQYRFEIGKLYFIPYTADFTPFCDESDPIIHTYVDFEMIPPVICSDILCVDIFDDSLALSALGVFDSGGRHMTENHLSLSDLFEDSILWNMCASSILMLISYITKNNGVESVIDEVIIKALKIIHLHIADNISIKDIAAQCYLSEDGFIRRFSKVVGSTPYAYLKNLRVRTALCLRENGMSLSDIADKVGYSDASSLAHAMSKIK